MMNTQMNFLRRGLALLLSGALLTAALSGCGANSARTQPEESVPAQTAEEVPETVDTSLSAGEAVSKEETVYVKAAPDGTVREVTVEGTLTNPGDGGLIYDYSNLTDLRNTEGDEEFIQQEDGTVLWENHGEDIHYKGKSSKPLPVSVRITYWLDGEEIAPRQLAGKSGSVRIRFDYENLAVETVSVNGQDVTVRVPFAAITAVLLSGDRFANVEVTNGKCIDMDGDSIVLGFALPGLSDSLLLADWEPTEELELPDYVELTADVTEFDLDFTATVFTSGLLEETELEALDDLDELIDDMRELQDATDELTDGVSELYDGAKEFKSYLAEYTRGAGQLDEGARAIAEGLKTLNDTKDQLVSGAEAIQRGLNAIRSGDLEALLGQLDGVTLPDGTKLDTSAAAAAIEQLMQDEQALHTALAGIEETLGQWSDFGDEAEAYSAAVETALAAARTALDSIPDDLTAEANRTARAQAAAAAEAALSGTDLTEEECSEIKKRISTGIDLSPVTDPVQAQLESARKQLAELPDLEIPQTAIDDKTVQQLVTDMGHQAEVLKTYAAALTGTTEELEDLNDLLDVLDGVLRQLDEGSGSLTEGAAAAAEGIEQLYTGAKALSEGTSAFKKAGSALTEGYGKLLDGMRELRDGVREYNEEGISKLTDLAGDDLADLLRRIRGVKLADDGYINFSGIRDGQTGSVMFIIETEGIKP